MKNAFGLFREYATWPTYNPDDTISLDHLSDTPTTQATKSNETPTPLTLPTTTTSPSLNPYFPFASSTAFGLMNWMWTGSPMKSLKEFVSLVNFLKSDSFSKDDLAEFDPLKETEILDKHLQQPAPDTLQGDSLAIRSDGWKFEDVVIKMPDGKKHPTPNTIPSFTIPGLARRSITAKNNVADGSDSDVQRIHDELFASDAMIEAHLQLQQAPREPDCTLERVVAALMFWSDSTHLATFGNASLWPIYLWFGNQSKWIRGKPTSQTCHHVAYIPKADSFEDDYRDATGEPLSNDLLTHARRELIHAVWKLILDGDFMHAVLLSKIRNLGKCPCVRCLIPKSLIPEVGTVYDDRRRIVNARQDDFHRQYSLRVARDFIYERGYGVKSAAVERILGPTSSVPTENAFSCLAKYGFNFHTMLVVDQLHEFELGVWKAVLTHLIRILYSQKNQSVPVLNRRYRQVPTFGRSTIRRFSDNVAGLKKLAAQNFEDLLQCAIPVFEGILDNGSEDDVLTLLFVLAEWHALAKLWLYTEETVQWLEETTREPGRQLRRFEKEICPRFDTQELPKEAAARGRRKAQVAQQAAQASEAAKSSTSQAVPAGDIPEDFPANTTRQARRISKGKQLLDTTPSPGPPRKRRRIKRTCGIPFEKVEHLSATPPDVHHHISTSRNFPEHLGLFILENEGDPALQDFYTKLQDHLLGRVLHPEWSGGPNDDSPSNPVSKEVLWIRWFKYDPTFRSGFEKKRLHRIHFVPSEDSEAFGFLDPDEVIRAAHLIPAFRFEPTDQWLHGESVARAEDENDDWHYFYVNIIKGAESLLELVVAAEAAGNVSGGDEAGDGGTQEASDLEDSDLDDAASGPADVDDQDLGAEDGEDGVEDFEDQEGYGAY
ncbi:hypothetical protein H0H93_015071 [Arthromyces matolae]|nr:hypothetical protein H0H93_015071 [Arthromyces matolae]